MRAVQEGRKGGEGRRGKGRLSPLTQFRIPARELSHPPQMNPPTSITIIQATPPQAEACLLDARFCGIDSSHHPIPNPHLTHVKASMATLCQLDTPCLKVLA